MLKNVDLPQWVIDELQDAADNEKRPLKLHMEYILEKAAKSNMRKRRIKKPKSK
jgi:hypothetical protein